MKPRKLKLLPGKRWEGTMRVGEQVKGGYVVDFDATVRGMATGERWVGDRTVLTAEQIDDGTGVRVDSPPTRQGGESVGVP